MTPNTNTDPSDDANPQSERMRGDAPDQQMEVEDCNPQSMRMRGLAPDQLAEEGE